MEEQNFRNINMEDVKNYITDNLTIVTEVDDKRGSCSIEVKLYLDNKIISKDYISIYKDYRNDQTANQ